MAFKLAATLACALMALASAEVAEHRITSLPGYGRLEGARQWSGYVETDFNGTAGGPATRVHTHYWFVENAARDEDAPVVVWMQGGPGGSSLIGLFTENGPFTLNDFSAQPQPQPGAKGEGEGEGEGEGDVRVFENPRSWHQLPANVLYVEHPAPTGFSFCAPAACSWDDESQARVSYAFMVRFFELFPEFAARRFFLTGESYFGVLGPRLAQQILAHRTEANRGSAPWSLQGIAAGNACPGNRVFTCTPYSGWIGTKVALDFRFRHGMISDETYAKVLAACEGQWGTYEPPASAKCRRLLEDPVRPVMSEAGDTYDMGGGYFLYDTCQQDLLALDKDTHRPASELGAPPGLELGLGRRGAESVSLNRSSAVLPRPNSGRYWCGQERASQEYLNRADVQKALHVRSTDFHFSTGLNYSFTAHSLVGLYREQLAEELDVLQYSGDADPCVPYIGTQKWVDSLELPVERPWAPWTLPASPRNPAGYLKQFRSRNGKHAFWFATVRDSGHMSPRYTPDEVFHLIERFLALRQSS